MWNLLTALPSFGFLVVAKQASTALVRSFTGQSLTKVKNHHTFYTNEMHVLSASRCARKTISSTYSQSLHTLPTNHAPVWRFCRLSSVHVSKPRYFYQRMRQACTCSVYIYPVYFVTLTDKFVSFSNLCVCVCVCVWFLFVLFFQKPFVFSQQTTVTFYTHLEQTSVPPTVREILLTDTVPFSTFSNSSPNFVGCTSIYFHWKNHFVNQTCSKNLTRRFIHSLYSFRRQLIK